MGHKESQEKWKKIFKTDYDDNDIVCSKENGNYIHPGRFSHKFSNGLKKAELPHIRFHDLRHTNATLMLKANIPAKIASQRLGHSNIGITMDLYSHVINEMQEEAVNMIEEYINRP